MHYIFDFDGTLADSMPYWSDIFVNALKKAGIPVPQGFIEKITPLGNVKATIYTISLGLDITLEEYLSQTEKTLKKAYGELIPLKTGVKQTLARLKSKGHTLSVLTAAPHTFIDVNLKLNGIYDMFDNIWSIDDFGLTKDNPEIYKLAAERLHADIGDCIFTDDNLTAIKTARASGMTCIAIYDETSKNSVTELKCAANKYVYEFSEID